MFLYISMFSDSPLELSQRDGSNEGSQHMVLLKGKKGYFSIVFDNPSYLEL